MLALALASQPGRMTPSVAGASEGDPDESSHPDENARSGVRAAARNRRDGRSVGPDSADRPSGFTADLKEKS